MGRPKGIPNKTTTALKEAILLAAEQAGGEGGIVGYLRTQATENPQTFMPLLGKVLPLTVQGNPEQPLHLKVDHTAELRNIINVVAERLGGE